MNISYLLPKSADLTHCSSKYNSLIFHLHNYPNYRIIQPKLTILITLFQFITKNPSHRADIKMEKRIICGFTETEKLVFHPLKEISRILCDPFFSPFVFFYFISFKKKKFDSFRCVFHTILSILYSFFGTGRYNAVKRR